MGESKIERIQREWAETSGNKPQPKPTPPEPEKPAKKKK